MLMRNCIQSFKTVTLCGMVALMAALAEADTFTWHGPNDAVGSGTFGTAGNWFDSTGNRTQTIPSSTDDVVVGNNGVNTWTVQAITFGGDATVASLKVEGGNVRALGKVAYLNLALGGYTFNVAGQLYMEGIQGWGGNQSGKCTIQNGTVNVASVQIGRAGEWSQGSGALVLNGSGAKLNSTGEIMMEGPFTTLQVSDGVELSGKDLTVAGQSANRSAIGGTGVERSTISISGSGTKVNLRGFALHHNVDATISDGAVVTTTSWGYYRHGSGGLTIASLNNRVFYGNCVGGAWGGYGTWCGNYGTLVVDNATYTSNPRQHFAVGCSRAASGGSGATLTLQNNAKFDSGEFFVGVSIEDTSYNSTNNMLNVLSGSELEATIVRVSQAGNSSFGKVNVSNATVKCQQLLMGNFIKAGVINSNAWLTVSGSAPSITLSSTSAEAFKVRMGSQVRFILPEDGFASAPISVSGGVSIVADENDYAVDPVRLVIDANAFGKKHPQESVTLIECATASADSLQRLANNLVFVDTLERRQGMVSVVGGTKLVYTAPPPLGTTVTIR